MADILPVVETLADIGTDHGKLLVMLIRNGKIKRGIGVEIVEGPLRRARANIEASGLADRVDLREGDGLAPVAPGEVSAYAIAGMGGGAITGILSRELDKAKSADWLLLQPMNGESRARHFLQREGWLIEKEDMVADGGKLYQIILAKPGYMAPLSPAQAAFGPLLLADKKPPVITAIKREIDKISDIIERLKLSDSRESREKIESLTKRKEEWEVLL